MAGGAAKGMGIDGVDIGAGVKAGRRASLGGGDGLVAVAFAFSSPFSAPFSNASDITVSDGTSTRRCCRPAPRLNSAASSSPLTSNEAAVGPPMRKGGRIPTMAQKVFATVTLKVCPSAASDERWRR